VFRQHAQWNGAPDRNPSLEVHPMNPFLPITGAVILAGLLITFVVPGGVLVVPVLLVLAFGWAAYRYVQGRHDAGPGSVPERPAREREVHEEPIP
jgi:hypothetical protein